MTDGVGKPPINPYIGARPFRRNETIYGRAREARDLLSLLVGDRIVLLNSPSGAGKTSLIQAALIPRLEQRRFAVRPTIRVGAPSPVPGANRYVLSVMQSLEDARPAAEQLAPEQLAGLSLQGYLAQRSSADATNGQVLIFDQFEEVLTLDPTDEPARLAFFEQLGDALADTWTWALFAIREEYVAALEPYTNLVPTRFANTFRLGLLGIEAARDAICGPPRARKVDFDTAAAEALAGNLAKIIVQDAEGRPVERAGISVEPVQLQVVCYRLWERRFPQATADQVTGQMISAEDVRAIGSIDDALEEYYESGVQKASAAGNVRERAVRSWLDTQMITRQGLRSQVLQGSESNFGLNDATINGLTSAYLVREERRRGVTWLELAHDRLIAPVRASNTRWFAANLSPLQRQAEIWSAQSQPASLLFRDAELAEAERWAAANADGLTDDERLFLDNCRAERRRAEERARQARRIRNLAIGASIAAVLAVIAAFTALGFYGQANTNFVRAVANQHLAETQQALAERNARVSTARELAAASLNRINTDPELSVLLGIQAVQATKPGDPEVPESIDALDQAVNGSRVTRTITLSDTMAYDVAYSPDGTSISAVLKDGTLRTWSVGQDTPPAMITTTENGEARALAYSPSAPALVTGDLAGRIATWDIRTNHEITSTAAYSNTIRQLVYSPSGELIAVAGNNSDAWLLDATSLAVRQKLPHAAKLRVRGVAFSPDGVWLASAGDDGTAKVWNVADGALLRTFRHPDSAGSIFAVVFSPNNQLLVTADSAGVIRTWDLTQDAPESSVPLGQLTGHTSGIIRLAFSPDGNYLASNSADGQIRIWNLQTGQNVLTLAGHSGIVRAASFSPDSQKLISASDDATLRVWRLNLLHRSTAFPVVYSPDGTLLASGDDEGVVKLWDAHSGVLRATLSGHTKTIQQIVFSRDGTTILTASLDGTARLWRSDGTPGHILDSKGAELYGAAFSPDDSLIATGDGVGIVHLWRTDSGTPLAGIADINVEARIKAIIFGRSKQELIIGDAKGVIHFWDTSSGRETRPALTYPAEITSLDRSPDGRTVAVAGFDPTPITFALDDPTRQMRFEGHSASISQLIFSADGRQLASVSDDKTIRIWDAASARQLRVFGLPETANPYTVGFNPAGTEIAVTGIDGIVRVIPLRTEDLLAMAQQRVTRPLTSLECKKYHLESVCAP